MGGRIHHLISCRICTSFAYVSASAQQYITSCETTLVRQVPHVGIQLHAHQLTGASPCMYRRLVRARAAHLTDGLDPRKRYTVRAGSVGA